ncbi:hypothetical protein NL676_038774 [Syzygium grande]|nr:hypothetical protein NL676_038774 [Syzygium grande]
MRTLSSRFEQNTWNREAYDVKYETQVGRLPNHEANLSWDVILVDGLSWYYEAAPEDVGIFTAVKGQSKKG